MSNVNTQIYDGIVDRSAMMRLYEQNTHNKVGEVFKTHNTRLDDIIRKARINSKSFKAFNKTVDVELKKTYREAYAVSSRSLLDLAADQTSYTVQNIEAAVSDVWRTQRPPRRIAENIVLKQPLHNNRTLAQGWSGVSNSERKRISQVIRRGIANGDTPARMALDVRKSNVHKITRHQARTLVTTSITSVNAQVDQTIYQANGKALRGWQYVAVLDGKTTDVCSGRDAKIFDATDTLHLPPAHYGCRSTTTPIVKSWEDLSELESIGELRRRNLNKLTPEQVAFYDGQSPLKESYSNWLLRQPTKVQYKHLGDYQKVDLFNKGQLSIDKFTAPDGSSLGIRQLRQLTSGGVGVPGDSKRFAFAKDKLDSMQLGATSPDDLLDNTKMTNTLREYYLLQSKDLDGSLSVTNYRGNLIGTKKAQKKRVLQHPPREDQLLFNPVTGRYDDSRMFQPSPAVLENNLKLVREDQYLLAKDKQYIEKFSNSLHEKMSVNERAVVVDNLRIMFTRYRKKPEPWKNFKAVSQSQIKFDIMNASDAIETQIRSNADLFKKLAQDDFIDPVLGPIPLKKLDDDFVSNILARKEWEDKVAPKIARELRDTFDRQIPLKIRWSLSDEDLQQFYLRFAHRLSLADSPDADQLAMALGRDLYNLADLNGDRTAWNTLGQKLVKSNSPFYQLETFGVQKRRMKSRMSGQYFGPYYDTFSSNIRIIDPRIQKYAKLNRSIDVGLRIGVTNPANRLYFREGYKTYFLKSKLGLYTDTRIPVTSTGSFSDFPTDLIDKDMVKALNWTSKTEYKVDNEFFDFTQKLLNFQDDRGKAAHFDGLNEYRKYIAGRDDAYERFKTMGWFRERDVAFSNPAFLDHRARIYDRGFIGPQSGETFRPYLNTSHELVLGVNGHRNFNDQIGAFLGGLDDHFEGRFNSLSITGRQKVAEKWRPEMVKLGNHMLRGKPNDIRAILDSKTVARIEGEELGKFFRFAMETAKIDNHLKGNYSKRSLSSMESYKTAMALEQDASSSGAQIIALTTKNKQLAELSNVVPTNQKRRLYDEIAAASFNDARFKKLNQKFGLTEKDLRKAAKAQNMVTFYGAGERTGILNVEAKLGKILGKDKNVLVVKASERDVVLNEISAQAARYERFDLETANELKQLRSNVRDVFNKGLKPGDDMMEQLYFLDGDTRELVAKMSRNYNKVVTPDDFQAIARIMSDHLAIEVPILKDFTKFLGRLAEEFLVNAKPSSSNFDWKRILKISVRGSRKDGYVLPERVSEILGLPANTSVSEQFLSKFGFWKPDGNLDEMIYGVRNATDRRTGAKYLKVNVAKVKNLHELEILHANKLPKKWTNIPWKNFDGKTIEQNFTQVFEERLTYKDAQGNIINNILQVPQKTEATWWEQLINDKGNINDIADATKARTAFAVNGNHSNDAVLVKQFHLWGADNKVPTSTIHDAFFANAAEMVEARRGLRQLYANNVKNNTIKATLDEMKARGLPNDVYQRYLNEAIEVGLIPVVGRSRINGRLMRDTDILTSEDILQDIDEVFEDDHSWYGVG